MGLFDEIRDALFGAGSDRRRSTMGGRRPPPPPAPGADALHRAQRERAAQGFQRRNGKRATARDQRTYERLEREITLSAGRFPWTDAEAERILLAKGFDPAHVRAYLDSPAARRLLGG